MCNYFSLNYHTKHEWTGEQSNGETTIKGGVPVMSMGSPHIPDRYSPEHLLILSAETCLANVFPLNSSKSRFEVKAYSSSTTGELDGDGKTGYEFKRIVIRPIVTVAAGQEPKGERLLEKAYGLCISRALKCPVDMEANIIAA